MFDADSQRLPDLLRSFTQQDLLASCIRVGLGLSGPVGVIMGEFLTQFVPQQRMDRLQDFVGKLAERIAGMEEQFKDRLASSAGFAALAEQASLSAVRAPSGDHRTDLAELLKHGLSRADAEMLEEQALLTLRDRVTDAQILILMSYGNYNQSFGDPELIAFHESHPGLFSFLPPVFESAPEERRRWTMHEHYQAGLEALGLLRDTEGVVKSESERVYEITNLGLLLLEAIGRYRDPGG